MVSKHNARTQKWQYYVPYFELYVWFWARGWRQHFFSVSCCRSPGSAEACRWRTRSNPPSHPQMCPPIQHKYGKNEFLKKKGRVNNSLHLRSEQISLAEEWISLDSNSSRVKIHYSTSGISSGSLAIHSKEVITDVTTQGVKIEWKFTRIINKTSDNCMMWIDIGKPDLYYCPFHTHCNVIIMYYTLK